jgi:hypothetical protein
MRILLWVAAILFAALGAQIARAENPMTFTLVHSDDGVPYGEGTKDYIYADGDFVSAHAVAPPNPGGGVSIPQQIPSTSDAFKTFLEQHPPTDPHATVVLNSGGGDVDSALAMGRMIRERHYWTHVGSLSPDNLVSPSVPKEIIPYLPETAAPPFPAFCFSACTIAFLGGEQRFVDYGSEYGVHRFSFGPPNAQEKQDPNKLAQQTLADAQQLSGLLAAYLAEMGVDPRWLYMMSRGGPFFGLGIHMTMDDMIKVKVVTPRWYTRANFEVNDDGTYYLAIYTSDPWGDQEIDWSCYHPAAATAPMLQATIHLEPGPRGKSGDIAPAVQRYIAAFDEILLPVADDAIINKASVDLKGRLSTSIQIPAKWLTLPEIVSSTHIGFAFLFDPKAQLPMRLLQFKSDFNEAQLSKLVKGCH